MRLSLGNLAADIAYHTRPSYVCGFHTSGHRKQSNPRNILRYFLESEPQVALGGLLSQTLFDNQDK